MILVPVKDTTEARYAEIARKMLETGDWITPQFEYGVPFWGKPPLHTWLSAAGMGAFGVNEFAARLPIFALACALLDPLNSFYGEMRKVVVRYPLSKIMGQKQRLRAVVRDEIGHATSYTDLV